MLNTFTIYYWFSLYRGLCFGWIFWCGSAPPAHIDEPRLDVHLSFPCLFPMSLEMCFESLWWDTCGKNKRSIVGLFCHKWHISELSTVRYWKWNYWSICPDLLTHAFSPSVNWISARSELALSVWKFGQDRCCAQFWPLTDYYPPSIGRFRVRCGGGFRIRQSDSDFNQRGNNLAGGRKWAQHRFQNKSLRHFCPVHCLSLIFREWIQNYSRNCFCWPLRWRNQQICLWLATLLNAAKTRWIVC